MATGVSPIWGRPYPLETDTPDVAADIHSLVTSLETTPLYPTTATASRALVAGESVVASPSVTLTTASSPTKGDMIQIIALGTVTGTTPVTVSIGGSKVVNGPGMSGLTLFPLGAPNASCTIQYDGTAWRVIQGAQDTGWLALTFSSPWAHLGGPSSAARQIGNRGALRSYIQASAGFSSGSTIATIPAAVSLPAGGLAVIGNNNATTRVYIESPGLVAADSYSNSGGVIYLDNITWLTD